MPHQLYHILNYNRKHSMVARYCFTALQKDKNTNGCNKVPTMFWHIGQWQVAYNKQNHWLTRVA